MKTITRFAVEWLDADTVQKIEGTDDYDPDSGTERVEYFRTLNQAVKFARKQKDFWGSPRISLEELRHYRDHEGFPYKRWEETHFLHVADLPEDRKVTLADFELQTHV